MLPWQGSGLPHCPPPSFLHNLTLDLIGGRLQPETLCRRRPPPVNNKKQLKRVIIPFRPQLFLCAFCRLFEVSRCHRGRGVVALRQTLPDKHPLSHGGKLSSSAADENEALSYLINDC